MEVVLHSIVEVVNAAELFVLKWLLRYEFHLNPKKKKKKSQHCL